jgi:hypothetical protein
MPKELEIEQSIPSDLDDEHLDALITQIRAELLAMGAEKPMPLIEAKLVEKVGS